MPLMRRMETSTAVAHMTKEELSEMIDAPIGQKLLEMLEDPDEGLHIPKTIQDGLLRQNRAVAGGEWGEVF